MSEIVGACLSQFHDDENSFELLLAYADGREIGHLVSRAAAQRIAAEFANEFGDTQPPAPSLVGFAPTHRHLKRGSLYRVIAHGRLQVDGDLDMEKVTVYQAEDGTTWVRPDYEFNDGRFEALAASEGSADASA